ncbi:unnamed protein product [Ixodes hexagonus]
MNGILEIPEDNSRYSDVAYWDARYRREATYDWLLPYEKYAFLLRKHVRQTDRILMLGCGNSPLSELLFRDGFQNVENIDYSAVVIDNMASHCDHCSQMKWHVMDATQLRFPDASFDVVIEKATLDSMMVHEKDPWNLSEETHLKVDLVLREVSRVLRDGGRFISITFAQPHFRGPLYANPDFGWSLETYEFGEGFHYFYYLMTKGRTLLPEMVSRYRLPVVRRRSRPSRSSESDNEDFLLRIATS